MTDPKVFNRQNQLVNFWINVKLNLEKVANSGGKNLSRKKFICNLSDVAIVGYKLFDTWHVKKRKKSKKISSKTLEDNRHSASMV